MEPWMEWLVKSFIERKSSCWNIAHNSFSKRFLCTALFGKNWNKDKFTLIFNFVTLSFVNCKNPRHYLIHLFAPLTYQPTKETTMFVNKRLLAVSSTGSFKRYLTTSLTHIQNTSTLKTSDVSQNIFKVYFNCYVNWWNYAYS